MLRHLLGRRSEAGLLAARARDWAHLFPVLPHQPRPAGGSADGGARSSSSGLHSFLPNPGFPGCPMALSAIT